MITTLRFLGFFPVALFGVFMILAPLTGPSSDGNSWYAMGSGLVEFVMGALLLIGAKKLWPFRRGSKRGAESSVQATRR